MAKYSLKKLRALLGQNNAFRDEVESWGFDFDEFVECLAKNFYELEAYEFIYDVIDGCNSPSYEGAVRRTYELMLDKGLISEDEKTGRIYIIGLF